MSTYIIYTPNVPCIAAIPTVPPVYAADGITITIPGVPAVAAIPDVPAVYTYQASLSQADWEIETYKLQVKHEENIRDAYTKVKCSFRSEFDVRFNLWNKEEDKMHDLRSKCIKIFNTKTFSVDISI